MRRLESASGITYIQVLFIVVLAGIVSALWVPYVTEQRAQHVRDEAVRRMHRIAEAQEMWYGTHGRFTDQWDSLRTIVADTSVFVNPLSGNRFRMGAVNFGQDYSISTTGENVLSVVTEDRWDEFLAAYRIWQAESTRQLQESEARRTGRRPPPR